MLVNINGIEAKKIKNLATFTYSQQTDSGLKNFPALILDRYSGVNGLTIWSRLGEEVGVEGGMLFRIYWSVLPDFQQNYVFG